MGQPHRPGPDPRRGDLVSAVDVVWLLAAAFAAIGLGISVAKSWQRAADSLDPDTLAHLLDDPHICDVGGQRWVRDRHGRSCADCWEIELGESGHDHQPPTKEATT